MVQSAAPLLSSDLLQCSPRDRILTPPSPSRSVYVRGGGERERERWLAVVGVCVWGWMGGETAGMRALNVCVRTATT